VSDFEEHTHPNGNTAGCLGCLHKYAHGVFDGYRLATPASEEIDVRRVGAQVRKIARMSGLSEEHLAELMRHHKRAET
jgi:hypothetical protein